MLDDDTLSRLRFLNGAPGGRQIGPTFRALGIHSVAFTRVYATTPLCCPSRATFFTGQHPQHHGIQHNAGGVDAFTNLALDHSTVATWLHDCGYRTMHLGKYFNQYGSVASRPAGFVPPGWDDWHVYTSLGQAGYWDFVLSDNGVVNTYLHHTDADYGIDVLRDKAVQSIASTPRSQPLFLYFAPTSPHEGAIPAPRHAGLRPNLIAPRPPANPAWLEADVSDKDAYVQAIPFPPTAEQIEAGDALYRNGANCLASVADAILAVVDAQRAARRLDRTVFLFTNDNGYSFLDHRLGGKVNPYETSARVYLGVATSNVALIATNRVERSLVGNVDVAPTIADLAGAPIPAGHRVDGRSLVPLIRSATAPPARTDLLLAGYGPEPVTDFPAWRAIVTGPGDAQPNWKYIDYLNGHVELYDLTADPFELASVSNDPTQQAVRSTLAMRLAQLLAQ